MKKVLIATKLDSVARDILQAHGGYQAIQDDRTPVGTLGAQHPDAYALIVRSEEVTSAVIDAMPGLKVVVRAGAGFNTIDTRYARARGIDVMNTPAANSNAVAEEVIALILADIRHIIPADASSRAGEWEKKKFMGRELSGKTVGILGLGHIGQLVARRLSGFSVRLLAVDPVVTKSRAEELGVELVPMETLFAESDFITLHLPENEETRGLVGKALLARMKPGATIVNCARAGIIDEAALRAAKAEKGIRFLNDVYRKDEPGPKSVADIADIMMPHLGASTHEANHNAARRAAEQIIEFDDKGITSFIVNREVPDGLDPAFGRLANMLARLCRGLTGRGAELKTLETSFYGSLQQFSQWLLVPTVKGLWEDIGLVVDYRTAAEFLQERGIEYRNRETDPRKGYENSITLDITSRVAGSGLRSVSVRGTVAESHLMIARINEFDKLYLDPFGHTVFFEYADRPGVLAQIGSLLARAGINIEDVRNPHDNSTGRSLATMKVNQLPSPQLVDEIAAQIQAISAFRVTL